MSERAQMLSIPERERRVLFGREGTGADADSDDEGVGGASRAEALRHTVL